MSDVTEMCLAAGASLHILLSSYISFLSVVIQLLHGHTHQQTHEWTGLKLYPALLLCRHAAKLLLLLRLGVVGLVDAAVTSALLVVILYMFVHPAVQLLSFYVMSHMSLSVDQI